jgi:hypothetical protein
MAEGTLGLSGICAANTEVAWASSDTTGFNNGPRNENRTWSYPTLRFFIVAELLENKHLAIPFLGAAVSFRAHFDPLGKAKSPHRKPVCLAIILRQ